MSDVRPGGDGEALPWLEAVEDEDDPPPVSAGKMLAAMLLVLLGVGIVAGTLFWVGRQDTGSGPPQLIRAEAGPYKVRPDDPGGLDVAGDSGTAYATGAGEDQDSQLDTSKLPEPPPPADDTVQPGQRARSSSSVPTARRPRPKPPGECCRRGSRKWRG